MSERSYVLAEDAVHLVNAASGQSGEYTLCGDAFDLGTDEEGYAWSPRKRGPVTCEKCTAIINLCRGVRTQ